ncbi:hypothetical protein AB4I99_08565 [Citrobacter murliniae]
MTTNHPAHGPVSLDRLHQIREILSKAAAQSDGGNIGYAMADAVKVIDGSISAFDADPQRNPVLAYADSYRDMAKRGVESIPVWSVITDLERNIAPLYATPPSPVVPDDVLDALQKVARIRLDLNDFDGDRRGIADCLGNAEEALIEVVNRSAAMLQGADGKPELTVWYGAMPETNGKTNWTAMLHRKGHHPWEGITIDRSEYPGRVRYEADRMRHLIGELADKPDILAYDSDAHSGYVEPVTTAYKLRDAVEIIRNSGIEIDAEKIFAERDVLNTPDCWCRTCRPVTVTDMRFVVCPDCGNKRCPHANDHRNACTGSNEPGQEGSAYPAAPQQENV